MLFPSTPGGSSPNGVEAASPGRAESLPRAEGQRPGPLWMGVPGVGQWRHMSFLVDQDPQSLRGCWGRAGSCRKSRVSVTGCRTSVREGTGPAPDGWPMAGQDSV